MSPQSATLLTMPAYLVQGVFSRAFTDAEAIGLGAMVAELSPMRPVFIANLDTNPFDCDDPIQPRGILICLINAHNANEVDDIVRTLLRATVDDPATLRTVHLGVSVIHRRSEAQALPSPLLVRKGKDRP